MDHGYWRYFYCFACNKMHAEAITKYAFEKLHAEHRSIEALEVLDEAIGADPSYKKAQQLKGVILLSLFEYNKGWPLYELWHDNTGDPKKYQNFLDYLWDGKPTDKHLVVWHDQGLGDTIQFLRYIPMVKELAPNLTLAIKPVLSSLVEMSFPGIPIVQHLPDMDTDNKRTVHVPISSLGAIFKTTVENIPNVFPYLKVLSFHRHDTYKGRIGICWKSGYEWPGAENKSMTFEDIKPLMQFKPKSLQIEDTKVFNFAETAAIMNDLDLVITVDTANAHLAGALNKKTWLMLPYDCSWRWGQEGETTPWYPSMKLFRQPKSGDWETVINQIEGQLKCQ